jgi:beta-1,4-mannosyltransferase
VPTRVLGWPAFDPRTGNPYSELLYRALLRLSPELRVDEFTPRRLLRGRYDVWHLHWPERMAQRGLVRTLLFALLVVWARLRGTRLVWTAHNLEGHWTAHPRLERRLMAWLSRRLDGLVTLIESGRNAVVERYPKLARARGIVVAHGHYVGRYPCTVGREQARRVLGLESADSVFAFVGRIHAYKNVERLIHEFRSLDDPRARLVVAGQPERELGASLRRAAAGDARIDLHLRDIPDDELQVFLGAADLVVLPYERVLNSGTALLALSFGRPVLVPDGPAMADLRRELGADAVRVYRGQLDATHLHAALDAVSPQPEALVARVRRVHDWDAIAERTLELYEAVAA